MSSTGQGACRRCCTLLDRGLVGAVVLPCRLAVGWGGQGGRVGLGGGSVGLCGGGSIRLGGDRLLPHRVGLGSIDAGRVGLGVVCHGLAHRSHVAGVRVCKEDQKGEKITAAKQVWLTEEKKKREKKVSHS